MENKTWEQNVNFVGVRLMENVLKVRMGHTNIQVMKNIALFVVVQAMVNALKVPMNITNMVTTANTAFDVAAAEHLLALV